RIFGQRQPGADTDVENASADLVGLRDGRPAALVEHLAENQIVDRRPAPISLFDPLAVDVPSHSLCPDFFSDHDAISSNRIMISSHCLSMIFSENRFPL